MSQIGRPWSCAPRLALSAKDLAETDTAHRTHPQPYYLATLRQIGSIAAEPKGSPMRLRLIVAAVLLSACQLSLQGKSPEIAAVNPITTGQISVTSLDAPAVQTEPAADALTPDTQTPDTLTPDTLTAKAVQDVSAPTAATAAAPPVTPPPPAAPPKSKAQIACEKGNGAWVNAGTTGTSVCQTALRDGGKQCSRDQDCEGQCLARSRSCAPYTPLFGCNEVLQDNGQRVTLCIE